MAKRSKENITLGSGKAYIMAYTAGATLSHTDICKPENLLGHIRGGAELTYTEETYEEKDDLGLVSKVITTSEEALLKLGLLTWNGKTLEYLADRCKSTEAGGIRTILIGGAGNSQGKEWAVCFFHEDKKDGNLWVIIRGRNTAGFTLTFAADAGTVVEPEFKALPQDENGTLITLVEEITAATGS
jgi:hypothetical protein